MRKAHHTTVQCHELGLELATRIAVCVRCIMTRSRFHGLCLQQRHADFQNHVSYFLTNSTEQSSCQDISFHLCNSRFIFCSQKPVTGPCPGTLQSSMGSHSSVMYFQPSIPMSTKKSRLWKRKRTCDFAPRCGDIKWTWRQILRWCSPWIWKSVGSSLYQRRGHPRVRNEALDLTIKAPNCIGRPASSRWLLTADCRVTLAYDHAVAQTISHRLPTAATRVRSQFKSCEICGELRDTGVGFLIALLFLLPVLSPPNVLYLSSWAGTVGQLVTDIPSGVLPTARNIPKERKRLVILWTSFSRVM
jgi:hypothetical protein